jgi:glycosyltransferase involved in cell wall biosynthesis
MRITFIGWVRYHRRTDLLAQHLGATTHFIVSGQPGNTLQAPLRYAAQSWQTWRTLRREQPDIVFVQNPPIFSVLLAAIYARRYGARYVIDSHTGAFLSPKWRWSLGLHRLLSREALATIVHNKSQERIVSGWRCPYCVVGFTPGDYPAGEPFRFDGRFSVVLTCGPAGDEPLDAAFAAASQLPDVCFYVTGGSRRIGPGLLAIQGENCRLTGYLPYDHYVGLLRGADAILAITTRDNTLLMGAFEAVSLGIPLIISDWPILQDYFSKGAVHIPNTAEGICSGVCRARREQAALRRDILCLRQRLHREWEREFAVLRDLLRVGYDHVVAT